MSLQLATRTAAAPHLVQSFMQPMFSERPPSRVLVVDDHAVMRAGLRSLLRDEPAVTVVGEADDGHAALDACQRLHPDMVLMDVQLSSLDGIDAIAHIHRRHPAIRIVVLASLHSESRAAQAFQAGADGYVLKRSKPDTLMCALHAAREGRTYLDPAIHLGEVGNLCGATNTASGTADGAALTTRERQILKLIAEGLRNREIAERLFISQKTVETHRMNLMRKLDAHNVAELSQWARRLDMVSV